MIEVQNLTIQMKSFRLQNIQLSIAPGEMFAILGKTGAGKSMLLEAVAGFYKPDRGAVYLDGKHVLKIPPEQRKIGFVYQDFGLFPHMTVYENIRYGLKMHRIPKSEAKRKIQEMTELLEIERILNQYPATLSGGERQRTALARALVLTPKVLFMDEPFSALDPNTKTQMMELLKRIHKAFSCTILFVTHNFEEAEYMADRVGIMINGGIRRICHADQLFQMCEDDEVNAFIGLNQEWESNQELAFVR